MEIAILLAGLTAWVLTYGLWKDESKTLQECLKYERSKAASLFADLSKERDAVLALEQTLDDRAEVDRQIRDALEIGETGSTVAAVKALRSRSEATTMRFSCGHCQAQIGDHSTTRDEALALWKEHATTCRERTAAQSVMAGLAQWLVAQELTREMIIEKYEYLTGRETSRSDEDLDDFYAFILGYYPAVEVKVNG